MSPAAIDGANALAVCPLPVQSTCCSDKASLTISASISSSTKSPNTLSPPTNPLNTPASALPSAKPILPTHHVEAADAHISSPLDSSSAIPSSQTHAELDIPCPPVGQLLPLRTHQEVEALAEERRSAVVQVWVVRIAVQAAQSVMRVADQTLKSFASLHHIRRVARSEHLPPGVRSRLEQQVPTDSLASELYVVLGRAALMPLDQIRQVLQPYVPAGSEIALQIVDVPARPPMDATSAASQSMKWWPIIYRAHNPYGPQPVERRVATAAVAPYADYYMALAARVAAQTRAQGLGPGIGAVIVETRVSSTSNNSLSRHDAIAAVAAVAGDARWAGPGAAVRQAKGPGNAMAHAAMRAIGMIGRTRVSLAAKMRNSPQDQPALSSYTQTGSMAELSSSRVATAQSRPSPIFLDHPLTSIETAVLDSSMHPTPLRPGGYVCAGLDLYLTHEPCAMCGMALLHSRFQRVIFGRRMPRTGSLAVGTDPVLSSLGSSTPEQDKDDRNRRCESNGVDRDSSGDQGRIESLADDRPRVSSAAPGQDSMESKAPEEIAAEAMSGPRLDYGLCWRPELNWKMHAWQWRGLSEVEGTDVSEETHA